MKLAKCLVERLNLFVWMIHASIMEYRPLLALLKGFYYTIRDIADNQAVLEGFVFFKN
ncbi:hypothetical protein [Helicobacter pylori]|uniref:hypothetical protein n=1 Tax=Helicobacter pylori TaxID=210 RepID=UPI00165CE03F|nr:hypothetical protein [Helicobacter pylori]